MDRVLLLRNSGFGGESRNEDEFLEDDEDEMSFRIRSDKTTTEMCK